MLLNEAKTKLQAAGYVVTDITSHLAVTHSDGGRYHLQIFENSDRQGEVNPLQVKELLDLEHDRRYAIREEIRNETYEDRMRGDESLSENEHL